MKLFVIVLCLLSERFLIHSVSFSRFNWFSDYYDFLLDQLKPKKTKTSPWLVIFAVIFPLVLITALVFYLFSNLLFGLIGLLLNILVFYYCLGPQNPFYPVNDNKKDAANQYLSDINGQLFAVIFWYIVSGPLGVIVYRSMALLQNYKEVGKQAKLVTNILDWVPARITVLCYMLVGHFQRGRQYFIKYLLERPEKNAKLLSDSGMASATMDNKESVSISAAESLVEHSLILFLVFLALLTLASWL